MRKNELEKQLAKKAGLSPAAARDEVDEVVRRVLGALRKGRTAELPGVGKLAPKSIGTARPRSGRK